MSATPGGRTLRGLYVANTDTAYDPALAGLSTAELELGLKVITGVADAVTQIRTAGGFDAVFVAADVPHDGTLALVSSLRRDQVPIAIIVILDERDREFLAPVMAAGADDVLVLRNSGLMAVNEALRRVRQSGHRLPPQEGPRLRVLYAGADGLAWSVLSELNFVVLGRTSATRGGVVSLRMGNPGYVDDPCDVFVVDELPGEAHTLEVVKWVKSQAPALPIIVLTPPAGSDLGGAALDLGADDVVSKAGTYRRRLLATLHRFFVRKFAAVADPLRDDVNDSAPAAVHQRRAYADESRGEASARVEASEAERHLKEALTEAHARIHELRQQYNDLSESQGFERVMRDRDRADLTSLRQSLKDERERRGVLEETLRHTEDRAKEQMETLEAEARIERRQLERQLEEAADRLHAIANETQVLQARLATDLAAQAAERDRLIEQGLFGYAVLTQDGKLVRCSQVFADMLGYGSSDDAVRSSEAGIFKGLPDHTQVVDALRTGSRIQRVESTARRADGRLFRVLTSADWLRAENDDAPLVERLVVDVANRTELEAQLQRAQRLEAVGRLLAEMSPEIEDALSSADGPDAPRVIALVRQLLAFSRRQAQPAGYLSLNDAISRAERLIRPIAGDAIELRLSLSEVESVAGSEDDIEQLIVEMVFAAAATLPYGGTLELQTATVTTDFVLRTQLTAIAAGFGALSLGTSPSLTRIISRCGGLVRTSGEAGRSNILHVILPS